jgi:hypothetical protein
MHAVSSAPGSQVSDRIVCPLNSETQMTPETRDVGNVQPANEGNPHANAPTGAATPGDFAEAENAPIHP